MAAGAEDGAARISVREEDLSDTRSIATRSSDAAMRNATGGFAVGQLLAGGRFRVLGCLGAGGMGAVYEGEDREAGAMVAIKTLLRVDADALYFFKREFRALSDIEHPNLIRLGELCCEGDTWFFTMERVVGVDWLAYVRPDAKAPVPPTVREVAASTRWLASARRLIQASPRAPSEPKVPAAAPRAGYDEARLRDALHQIVTALVVVHRSGRVHRDVKPSNVKVTDDGRVVLLDFGLVTDQRRGVFNETDEDICGTPMYMAPEQAIGGDRVGPAADVYAVGVMLYQALTGLLPWAGRATEILSAKQRSDGPSPRETAPDVPADLDALCAAMLRRNPAARPSGEDVLRALGEGDRDAEASFDALDTPLLSAPFVGRSEELAQLILALCDAKAGNAVTVLVEGEPGMGKTALVRRFLDDTAATDPSLLVLSGRCYEQERLPFKAFDAIVDALSRRLSELAVDQGQALLAGGVRFLATLFPVLRRVIAVERLAPASQVFVSPDELRVQAFHELKSLLRRLARVRTVALFIDDLQWADAESLDLLRELCAPPDAPPCLIVATARTAAGGAPVNAVAHLVETERAAPIRRLRLAGLSDDESRSLVAELAGTRASIAPPADMGRLVGEASGHPLFLAELSRFTRTASMAPSAGLRLEDVLWRRITSLDDGARKVLELSALAGVPTKSDVLARAANLEDAQVLALLARLRDTQLVRVSRRGASRLVEPFHDRVREAIVQRLPDGGGEGRALEEMHLRLGRAMLSGATEVELEGALFRIVHHLQQGAALITDPVEIRALAGMELGAGRAAHTATAYEKALTYFNAGLARLDVERALVDDYELVRDLLWGRVEAEYLTGRRGEALAHFEELLTLLQTLAERVDLFVRKVELDTAQRHFADAIGTAYRALEACGETLPAKATTPAVLGEYVATRWYQGSRAPRAILELPPMEDETKRLALKVLIALAPPAYFYDTPLLSVTLMRIARLSYRHGVSELSAYGFAGYGLVLTAAFGQAETGYALGRACIELDERFGGRVLGSKLHFVLGVFLAPWVRPFREAQEIIRRGIDLGRSLGDVIYEAYNAGKLATMTLYEGRSIAETEAAIGECLAIAEKRNDVDMAMVCTVDLGFCRALREGAAPRKLRVELPPAGRADPRPARVGSLATASPAHPTAAPDGVSDQRTPIAIFFYFLLSAQLAYFAGDARLCLALLAEVGRRKNAQFGIVSVVDHSLFEVLAYARLARTASLLARLIGRVRMALSRRAVEGMARRCPENFEARARIARGAELGAMGRVDEALALLDGAAAYARGREDAKHEAMARALAADLAAAKGRDGAPELRRLAVEAYGRWGASPATSDVFDEPGAPQA